MTEFMSKMSKLLSGEELVAFKSEYSKPAYIGLRVNTLKCSVEKFLALSPSVAPEQRTPFCHEGFYLNSKEDFDGNHPLHHAGAAYFQEPSAMSAAELLAPKSGESVLDLCAAPGGKSTQLAAALNHTGLLWSNEIVASRANILLSNFERTGIRNGVVSNADPSTLCTALEGYFDKVMVDAPCSGEGMFRREPKAILQWSPEHSRSCKIRQLNILESAKKALKPSGVLVYSTCTFSHDENEDVIESFLKNNPNFELVNAEVNFGRPTLSGKAVRIFPMDGGEGHFAAKLRKKDGYEADFDSITPTNSKLIPSFLYDFLKDSFFDLTPYQRLYIKDDKAYALPEHCPRLSGTHTLRAGVFLGTLKKGFFEPAHALYMSAEPDNVKRLLNLSLDDPRLYMFLHGEEIDAAQYPKGYTAVAVEGIITGFGKVSGGKLKNKYPKGLRILS